MECFRKVCPLSNCRIVECPLSNCICRIIERPVSNCPIVECPCTVEFSNHRMLIVEFFEASNARVVDSSRIVKCPDPRPLSKCRIPVVELSIVCCCRIVECRYRVIEVRTYVVLHDTYDTVYITQLV